MWHSIQNLKRTYGVNFIIEIETVHWTQKQFKDLLLFYLNTTPFSIHKYIVHMSLEVLDLDFVKQTSESILVNAKSKAKIFMKFLWILLWIEDICREFSLSGLTSEWKSFNQ